MESLNQIFFLSVAALNDFSEGFWYGVGVTLTVGLIIFLLAKFWGKISVIFKSTKVPATNLGPSPLQKLGGCVVSLLILVVLIVIAAYFLQFVFL